MVTNSSIFLLYFLPVFLIVYYLLNSKHKNVFLLLASIFIYAWGAPKFVFVIMGSVIIDYYVLLFMSLSVGRVMKALFWLSLLLNLGLLLYFKYMNFFVDQMNGMLGWIGSKPANWTRIMIPIGISFITFQKLAYTLDVYHKKQAPFTKIRDYIFLPLAYLTSRKLPKERYLGLRADKIIYLIATSVTFLLCGFWHGAAWTFILWGIYMGVFLIIDKLFLLKYLKKTGKVPAILITFFVLIVGWVIFRSQSADDAWFFIRRMFQFRGGDSLLWLDPKFWTMFGIAIFFSFWGGFKKVESWIVNLYSTPGNGLLILFSVIAILLLILNEATIASSGFSPFIYFRF